MFEAEIKYTPDKQNLRDIEKKLKNLPAMHLCHELYEDTYYDSKDGSFYSFGRELRVRRITNYDSSKKKTLLTFKEIPFDTESRSKAEHEVQVSEAGAIERIIIGLGFVKRVSLSKECNRYRYSLGNMMIEITLAMIDSLNDEFIEIEAMLPNETQAKAALQILRDFGTSLGLSEKEICNEYYTDMVMGRD